MRKLLAILIALLAISTTVDGQQTANKKEDKIKIEAGFSMFNSYANRDWYLSHNNTYAYDGYECMKGVSLKFTIPTKRDYIDFVFGAVLLDGPDYGDGYVTPYYEATGHAYRLNGGGVYAGISPKWKTKYFGLTADLAVGIFPFKEYNSIVYRNFDHPIGNISMQQSRASVFGAMASVGFYVQLGRVSINPTINAIFAGGANTSFLFYGFVLPLAIQF